MHKWEYFFLAAAFVSFLLANAIYFGWIETTNPSEVGIFVGHWVTSILAMLTYLKVLTSQHHR